MSTAKVGDINIYYDIYGEGKPLVLIYGYAGHSELWFEQIPVLGHGTLILTPIGRSRNGTS